MDSDAVVLGTITFEELPLHVEFYQSLPALRPSSIEEDEDDPRSLLYLFEDNDFERAAAFLAFEEARQQAQVEAVAEALIEAEVERQRTRALADRLRQLLEEDDELVDMLGRRILATKGYQMPDLWNPHQYHHHHYHRNDSFRPASGSDAASQLGRAPYTDIHAAWDAPAEQTAMPTYSRASPFIHSAPVIVRGHAPYPPRAAKHIATPSRSPVTSSSSRVDSKAPTQTHTRIAIHPLTGVPMLLVEQDVEGDEHPSSQTHATTQIDTENETDDDTDEWPIDDESDLDWLGRELLRLRGGANVWVLGADHDVAPLSATPSSSKSARTAFSSDAAAELAKRPEPEPVTPTLPTQVEEVDSDYEASTMARALQPGLASPSQRVAAALAQAALHTPSSDSKSSASTAGQRTRQRAATVMSESEEEELETVGRPVDEHGEEQVTREAAGSLDGRP